MMDGWMDNKTGKIKQGFQNLNKVFADDSHDSLPAQHIFLFILYFYFTI